MVAAPSVLARPPYEIGRAVRSAAGSTASSLSPEFRGMAQPQDSAGLSALQQPYRRHPKRQPVELAEGGGQLVQDRPGRRARRPRILAVARLAEQPDDRGPLAGGLDGRVVGQAPPRPALVDGFAQSPGPVAQPRRHGILSA